MAFLTIIVLSCYIHYTGESSIEVKIEADITEHPHDDSGRRSDTSYIHVIIVRNVIILSIP